MTEIAKDFDSILEQCLDQISAGKATIWNCLARYPDLAGELEPLLLAAEQMWTVPKPALSSEARARIDAQVFSAARPSEGRQSAARQSSNTGRSRGWASVWRWAAAGLALFLVFFLSLTVVSDVVGKTLPGSPLHPVKLVAEDTRLWLTPSQDKPKLQLEFARRRLEEVAALIELGDVEPSAVNAMTEETEAALRGLEALPPDVAVPLMGDMVALISEQDQALSNLLQVSQSAPLDQVATALEANEAQAARSRSLVSSLPMPPSILVLAAANLDSVPEPEGEVEYTVQVSNDGAERVTVISLLSDIRGDLNGQGTCSLPPEGILLSPRESYICLFGGLVTGNADQAQTDTVTAVAVDGEGYEARVSTSATVLVGDVVPVIGISKTPNRSSVPEPGEPVEFKVRVSNDGLETVALTSLEDVAVGDLNGWGTCLLPTDQVTIVPGGAFECAFSAMVAGNAGTHKTNTVTAAVADDEGNIVRASADAVVSIMDVAPVIAVSKTVTPGSVLEPAAKVECTVRVTNLGVEDVNLDALVDDARGDLHGRGTCTLAPGEVTIPPSGVYECSYTAKFSGNAGDSSASVVTAIVSDDEGNRTGASDSALVTIADALPEIEVGKSVEPGRVPEPGAQVEFAVQVANRGEEPVRLESLVDDVFGDLDGKGSCSLQPGGTVVDPGKFYRCSFVSKVNGNADDTKASAVTVLAVDDEGNQVKAKASAAVTITDVVPVIEVRKTASPSAVPEPGGAVEYTVHVTNESVEEISLLSLLDDVYGDLNELGTCSLQQDKVQVSPGSTYSCSFTRMVSGNAAESRTDTVTAIASDDEGNRARAIAGTTVTLEDVPPTIAVTKTANPDHVSEPQGSVDFAVRVANNGPEPVSLSALVDDAHGDLSGQGTCSMLPGEVTIGAGGSYDCSYSALVAGNAGEVKTSTVTAAVSDDDGNRVKAAGSAAVMATDIMPQIDLSLAAKPDTVPESGGLVKFRVRIANESFEAVNLRALEAESRGDLDGRGSCSVPEGGIPLSPRHSDGPSEPYECTFSVKVSGNATDVIAETVHAVVVDDEGNEVKTAASDTVALEDVLPAIGVSLGVEPSSMSEPEGDVTFSVHVSNEGPEEVTLGTLVDDVFGNLHGKGTCSVPQAGVAIRPGESYACEFQARMAGNAGETRVNSVTAVASDDEGNEARSLASASVTIADVLPALKVSKMAEPASVPEPGAGVAFTVRVSNGGQEAFAVTSLVDDVYGDLSGLGTCSVPQEGLWIQGGGTYSCSFQSEILGNAGVTETSTVTAVASDDEGNEISAVDRVTVTISDVPPAIAVDMTANPNSLPEPGGAVEFAVTVTNQGIEDLSLDSLVDDIYGNLLGQGTCTMLPEGITLGPGASHECSFQADVRGNAGQDRTNTVTAVASDDEGNAGIASAGVAVSITDVIPVIGLEVSVYPSNEVVSGGEVEFSVRVSNLGIEAVALGRMVDDIYGDLSGQGTCTFILEEVAIDPGEAYECAFSAVVSGDAGGTETHTVSATAFDDEGNEALAVSSTTITLILDPGSSAAIVCQSGSGVELSCPSGVPVVRVVAKSHWHRAPVHQKFGGIPISAFAAHLDTTPPGILT